MLDIPYRLLRKLIGTSLYERLRTGPLGRPVRYSRLETWEHIFAHYRRQNLHFRNNHVVEIGPGKQFFTALFALEAGARSVIHVEPSLDSQQAEHRIREHHCRLQKEYPGRFDAVDPARVSWYPSLEEVPGKYNGRIGLICSHFVLEHFRSLDSFFAGSSRLLASRGICYSFVDLSDHALHIFDSRPLTRWIFRRRPLAHLRFSDAWFRRLCDQRIFVNRDLLPVYLEKAKAHGLKVTDMTTLDAPQAKIHPDLLARCGDHDPALLRVTHFSLTLTR